jgi:hypothetical protein
LTTPRFTVAAFAPESLFQALSNKWCTESEVASQGRAKYLAGYLRDIGARSIVVEADYIDGDYLDDFASYYVRCFGEYERRCKRLHFFSSDLDESLCNKLFTGHSSPEEESAVRNAYLGFVVARPLPSAIVGRTILRHYSDDNGRRHYTSVREYYANLFGLELSVRSLAFQEQDSVLAACATVALWCAFHQSAHLFGSAQPRPATITRAANGVQTPARSIPSHGLSIEQMCLAVRGIDLEPELIPAKSNVPLLSLIYGHLKAGLPVVLAVEVEGRGLHAITLAGFSLKKTRVWGQEVAGGEKSIPMIGLRIDEFYGHDDQIGPFARLYVRPSAATYPVLFDGSWKDNATGKVLALRPKAVLVPVYNKIRVSFLDAQKWLTRLTAVLRLMLNEDKSPMEWDLHLITTNAYKKLLKKRGHRDVQSRELLLRQHPRFIWRALLRTGDAEALELLIDATDMARSFPIYEIIWHDAGLRRACKTILSTAALTELLHKTLTPRFFQALERSAADVSPPTP